MWAELLLAIALLAVIGLLWVVMTRKNRSRATIDSVKAKIMERSRQ